MRKFADGATRDDDTNKLDFEAFNNPLVDKCYANYLHKHRVQSDGSLRDGDNWQKLFGDNHTDVCIKSICRHTVDARLAHRGYRSEQPIMDSLCAIIFNANAYLLKLMLEEEQDNEFSDLNIAPPIETIPGCGGVCGDVQSIGEPGRSKPTKGGY